MRLLLVMSLAVGAFLLAGFSQAHAPYVLTEGQQVTLVFSDELAPDPRVKETSWKKMASIVVMAYDAEGKGTPVKMTMGEACMKGTVPAGTVRVEGKAPYGVSTKGETSRFLYFYPRAVLAPTANKADANTPLVVNPRFAEGKIRFAVLQAGKPASKVEVSVIVPGKEETEKVTTDDEGMTPAFSTKGKYGVTVRVTEKKGGASGEEKYDETMHVATLVVDLK
jgi:hypothetical protein